MWKLEFTSKQFLPTLPEACQVNPGAYGFELAYWLAQALFKRGLVTSYPISEDWGWLIEHCDESEVEYMIGCSSLADVDEGYAGRAIQWSIFVKPHLSWRERLKGVERGRDVERIGAIIEAVLRDAGVLDPTEETVRRPTTSTRSPPA